MASLHDPRDSQFDSDDDDDDSQFDSDDGGGSSAAPVYAPSDFIPTPSSNPSPAFYHNGAASAAQALHASYTALTAPDLLPPYPSPKRPRSSDADSRRIFQKLWTDEDEIAILQGFLDFTTLRGTTHADYQYDTGPFFDQIRTRLQLDFNKNQLVEKLRRLKRKYRTAVNRLNSGKDFKTAHDRATFEISQKIWNSDFKRERKRRCTSNNNNIIARPAADFSNNAGVNGDGETHLPSPQPPQMKMEAAEPVLAPAAPAAPSAVEETVKSCLAPLFKDLLQVVVGGTGGLMFNPPALPAGPAVDERWRQQQILELEVFMKRTELVQEQVTRALEELRSRGDGKTEPELNTTDGVLELTTTMVNAVGTDEIKDAWVEEVKSVGAEELMSIEELKPIVAE